MFKKATVLLVLMALLVTLGCTQPSDWAPVEGKIMSQWVEDINPAKPLPEYPRPIMKRDSWINLNGEWDYAICPINQAKPDTFDGKILVPYPVESALSGVKKTVGEKNVLWYQTSFKVPGKWRKGNVLLHFGAVDWKTTVWVNGKEVGVHKGGYDPFSFDITDALTKSGKQELTVAVWDPTDKGTQPRGKQIDNPHGIWYTAVTGIWQTVWVEPVAKTSIADMHIQPNIDKQLVKIDFTLVGDDSDTSIQINAKGHGLNSTVTVSGKTTVKIPVPNPNLWTPDNPALYDFTVTLFKDGKKVDEVDSYFAMRKIDLCKDEAGINRLCLNNDPLFQYGPLDQGWWPDGLYTAPTDEALKYDIVITKELGCNMLRKHVKVEPQRFYYWCDTLGILVWQDMPSGDRYIRKNQPDIVRTKESKEQYYVEHKALIDSFRNHPSIVMWVPFNEGWGQFDTAEVVEWVKNYDPSRLVNNASGWADRGVGDVMDVHIYPGPGAPANEPDRAAVLGEFGGLGLPVEGHTWQDSKNWGYRSFQNSEELTDMYVKLIQDLRGLIKGGLAAAVYTQTTDVEVEVNGFLTYDRAVMKMDKDRVAEVNNKLYLPPPVVKTVVPTAQQGGQKWMYTTDKPGANWFKSDFNDSGWKNGISGFGTENTPGTIVRTVWDSSDIWIRRTVELKAVDKGDYQLSIHHDEDATVYINGVKVATLSGYTGNYTTEAFDKRVLKEGKNTIAIHCKQTRGGQYIDAGIIKVVEVSK